MRNVIFEANCLYYKNDEVSVSCEEDVMNICITGDSRSVYLTPSQAKAMSLAVMRRFCFDPIPDPLAELERRVVETAIARHIAYKECDASRANSDGYARGVAIARAANSSDKAHREAVDALLVARAPKDPVAELREAWTDWNVGGEGHQTAYARLERAITALEAAR